MPDWALWASVAISMLVVGYGVYVAFGFRADMPAAFWPKVGLSVATLVIMGVLAAGIYGIGRFLDWAQLREREKANGLLGFIVILIGFVLQFIGTAWQAMSGPSV
jgi:hypothetical protein